jgi:hypothetical protein
MPADPSPTGRRMIRCHMCGWTETVTFADLARYAETGWPTCCGQAMAMYVEAERPRPPADGLPPSGP